MAITCPVGFDVDNLPQIVRACWDTMPTGNATPELFQEIHENVIR